MKEEDKEEEAEDARRKRPAAPLTVAPGILGILMLIHRRGWGAEQPSNNGSGARKSGLQSPRPWKACRAERRHQREAAAAPRGPPARRGPWRGQGTGPRWGEREGEKWEEAGGDGVGGCWKATNINGEERGGKMKRRKQQRTKQNIQSWKGDVSERNERKCQ